MESCCIYLKLLLEIYWIIPLSSVECERYFSRLNLIKTRLRNCLEAETLDSLMNISINGPEIKNITKEDYYRMIQKWLDIRKRIKLKEKDFQKVFK